MKVVIFAGGRGTRLSEETDLRPKPMVEIGGYPILRHIMKFYSCSGFKEFYVALGYRGDVVKRYFLDYYSLSGSMTVNLARSEIIPHDKQMEDWIVHLIDTGDETQTGGRIKRLESSLKDGPFMMTYGDGLSNVDLHDLLRFHKSQGKLATVTAVCPPADDDFLVPTAFQTCVNFLEENSDYGIVPGRLLFVYEADEANSRPEPWTLNHSQHTIDDDAYVRLCKHLLNYVSTFYSVHRRLTHLRNMELASMATEDLFLGELLPSCLGVIQGKLKYLGVLYGVRPEHTPDATSRVVDRLDLPDLLASDDFSSRYARFRDSLAAEPVVRCKMRRDEARTKMNNVLLEYMTRYMQPKYGIAAYSATGLERVSFHFAHMIQKLPTTAISASMRKKMNRFLALRNLSRMPDYVPVRDLLDTQSRFYRDFANTCQICTRYTDGMDSMTMEELPCTELHQ
jgi:glucose-1-phosphate cytidylyltransferase